MHVVLFRFQPFQSRSKHQCSKRIHHGGLPKPLARLPKNNAQRALTRYTREGGATTNTQRRKVAEEGLTLMTIKGDCPVALCTLGPSMVHFCGQSPVHAVMPPRGRFHFNRPRTQTSRRRFHREKEGVTKRNTFGKLFAFVFCAITQRVSSPLPCHARHLSLLRPCV